METKIPEGKRYAKRISTPKFIEIWRRLNANFPNAFSLDGVKVLKHGIHLDLRNRSDLSNSYIAGFLHEYSSSPLYRKLTKEGAARYDLDGNVCGYVTAADVELGKKLKKLYKKMKAEKKQ